MDAKIAVLPGDGIGLEVTAEARRVLLAVAQVRGHHFAFETALIGGAAIDDRGMPLPDETLELCKAADAVLFGAVGGPKWDDPKARVHPEQGLLSLRRGLGLFANLRPIKPHPALVDASPIKAEILAGTDMMVVRELTGGIYFGQRGRDAGGKEAFDTMVYSEPEIDRVVEFAFRLARDRRRRVTSVDKANVLECSRLWRETAMRIAMEYPDVAFENMLVDACAMHLIRRPSTFDVIVTENMFGDILTDEASMLTGSLGMLPSASLSLENPGLYEPIHGSAPDIAGRGIANPLAAILSAAMLLRYSLKLEDEARLIEKAVDKALAEGYRTPDIEQPGTRVLGTQEMGDLIVKYITA